MRAPVDFKSVLLNQILNTTMSSSTTTTTTTVSTTTDFAQGRYNLTPLMLLLAVAITIIFFCICSTAYNSVLKREHEREVDTKHITYGMVFDDMWRCGNIFSKFCCLSLFVKPHVGHDDNAIPETLHYHSHRLQKDEETLLITPGETPLNYDTTKPIENGGFEVVQETVTDSKMTTVLGS